MATTTASAFRNKQERLRLLTRHSMRWDEKILRQLYVAKNIKSGGEKLTERPRGYPELEPGLLLDTGEGDEREGRREKGDKSGAAHTL